MPEPSIQPIATAIPLNKEIAQPTLNLDTVNVTSVAVTSAQVLATIIAVEKGASQLPGTTKAQIVLDSVLAGSSIVATNFPNERVQQIAALINLFVGIFNATGIFKKRLSPTLGTTINK